MTPGATSSTQGKTKFWRACLFVLLMSGTYVGMLVVLHGVPPTHAVWLEYLERTLIFAIPFSIVQVIADRYMARWRADPRSRS